MVAYCVSWAALCAVVVALAGYRRVLSRREDDRIHLAASELSEIFTQQEVADRISRVDRWGIGLTVVLAVYGLILGGVYVAQVWQAGSKIAN
jgi:hypothetical protein